MNERQTAGKTLQGGTLIFLEDRCKGCELCTTVCPVDIVKMTDRFNSRGYRVANVTEADKCILCLRCAIICPDIAIVTEG